MSTAPSDAGLALLLRISRKWRKDMTDPELYEATRGYWRVAKANAANVTHALAVAHGVVRAAYDVTSWHPSVRRGQEGRMGFDGTPSAAWGALIGVDVSHVFPPGSQNPVRYIPSVDLERLITPPVAGLDEELAEPPGYEPSVAEQVTPIVSAFENDLMWHMARGAHELFHSNTLAYLMSRHSTATAPVTRLFAPSWSGEDIKVDRELRHLDIVAEAGPHRFVVENKTYSIPNQQQLARYAEKPLPWSEEHAPDGAPGTDYVLLSLLTPTWELRRPWRTLSYEDVGYALDLVDPAVLGDDAALFERYRWLTWRLVELTDAIDPNNDLDRAFSLATALHGLVPKHWLGRLQKMRYTGLGAAIQNRCEMPVSLTVDLTRGIGLIEHLRPIKAWDTSRWVGWQLQGDQLRLAVLVRDDGLAGRDAGLEARRAAAVEADHLDWFDFDALDKQFGDRLTPKTWKPGRWNHYKPDFVYRYRKIDAAITTRELAGALAELTAHTIHWADTH